MLSHLETQNYFIAQPSERNEPSSDIQNFLIRPKDTYREMHNAGISNLEFSY